MKRCLAVQQHKPDTYIYIHTLLAHVIIHVHIALHHNRREGEREKEREKRNREKVTEQGSGEEVELECTVKAHEE